MITEIKKISGVDVIFAPQKDATTISFLLMSKAGSIYENKENNGITHFLEHMFFKGGKKYPNSKKLFQAIDNIGASRNGTTSKTLTKYYIKLAPIFRKKGLDILLDILINPIFDEKEIENEKGVVIQEIKMYNDDPSSLVWHKFENYLYGDNPFGRSTLGKEENILKFTKQDLLDYKNSLYTKDNIVFVVAGNIKNQKEIEKILKDYFTQIPDKKTKQIPKYPQITSKTSDFFKKGTEQNHLIIGIPGFNIFDKKHYAADMLADILGGLSASRLIYKLRDKLGLCYYISSFHIANEYDGFFYIMAGLDKKKFSKGIKTINQEIDKLMQKGIKKIEFNTAKNYVKGSFLMGLESSLSLAKFLGTQRLLKKEIKNLEEILDIYKKINFEEVNQITKILDKRFTYRIE